MQKSLLSLVLVAGLVTLFQNCGGHGTDTGNPKTAGGSIAVAACDVLVPCNPGLTVAVCREGLRNQSGIPAQIGLNGYSTLVEVEQAELLNQLTPDETNWHACTTEIRAQLCTDAAVLGAYNGASNTPFYGAPAMIPQTGACPRVF